MEEQLRLLNEQIIALENKKGELTIGEIWDLSDLRDQKDDLLILMERELQEQKNTNDN